MIHLELMGIICHVKETGVVALPTSMHKQQMEKKEE